MLMMRVATTILITSVRTKVGLSPRYGRSPTVLEGPPASENPAGLTGAQVVLYAYLQRPVTHPPGVSELEGAWEGQREAEAGLCAFGTSPSLTSPSFASISSWAHFSTGPNAAAITFSGSSPTCGA